MVHENYGGYECVSQEKDYTKVVKKYHLEKQIMTETHSTNNIPAGTSNVSAVTLNIVWITLGLSVAVFFK